MSSVAVPSPEPLETVSAFHHVSTILDNCTKPLLSPWEVTTTYCETELIGPIYDSIATTYADWEDACKKANVSHRTRYNFLPNSTKSFRWYHSQAAVPGQRTRPVLSSSWFRRVQSGAAFTESAKYLYSSWKSPSSTYRILKSSRICPVAVFTVAARIVHPVTFTLLIKGAPNMLIGRLTFDTETLLASFEPLTLSFERLRNWPWWERQISRKRLEYESAYENEPVAPSYWVFANLETGDLNVVASGWHIEGVPHPYDEDIRHAFNAIVLSHKLTTAHLDTATTLALYECKNEPAGLYCHAKILVGQIIEAYWAHAHRTELTDTGLNTLILDHVRYNGYFDSRCIDTAPSGPPVRRSAAYTKRLSEVIDLVLSKVPLPTNVQCPVSMWDLPQPSPVPLIALKHLPTFVPEVLQFLKDQGIVGSSNASPSAASRKERGDSAVPGRPVSVPDALTVVKEYNDGTLKITGNLVFRESQSFRVGDARYGHRRMLRLIFADSDGTEYIWETRPSSRSLRASYQRGQWYRVSAQWCGPHPKHNGYECLKRVSILKETPATAQPVNGVLF